MEKTYTFTDLINIISRLRDKNGCPWDREQTHKSLTSCMIEEAYEVVDAIRIMDETGFWQNLCEELGDVLLQVVMHSQIAAEEGHFTYQEVIQGICEKMIRRHPHVFGQGKAEDSAAVLLTWEAVKRQEKQGAAQGDNPLREIPHSLPALFRSEKVQKRIASLYEPTPDSTASLKIAENILKQIKTGITDEKKEMLYGELLWHIVNSARNQKIHSEQALNGYLELEIAKKDREVP